MGRKVFISFLGNTNYSDTVYKRLDGTKAPLTPFVQEVLFDELCSDWDNSCSSIYIVCTEGDNGSYKKNYKMDATNRSLLGRLKNKPYFECIQKPILLEEGLEKDIWAIFSKIDEEILLNDEVYLDITNAFRSFPTFATTLLQYERFMKKIDVAGIYYGLYIPQSPEENAVLDLSSIIQLQECVEMANSLVSYGRLNVLADGLAKIDELNEVSVSLRELDQALSSNIGDTIRDGQFKTQMDLNLIKIRGSLLPVPTKDLIENVISRLSDFQPNGQIENLLAASRWAFEHQMIPQAYAFGKEYINRTAEMKLRKLNPYHGRGNNKKYYLEFINVVMSLNEEVVMNRSFIGDLAYYKSTTEHLLSIDWIIDIREKYVAFNECRNAVAHSKSGYTFEKLKSVYEDSFEYCVSVVQNAPKADPIIKKRQSEPLFVNLTNHSSSSWSELQLEEAKKYGRIIDLPFPNIDETANEQDITSLVEDYIAKIMVVTCNMASPVTVHVMGEMTFTYEMVYKLQLMGCKCVASTTKLIDDVLPDGTKKSQSQFSKFREYRQK